MNRHNLLDQLKIYRLLILLEISLSLLAMNMVAKLSGPYDFKMLFEYRISYFIDCLLK